MIKYSLVCDKAHEFESWFSNSAAYDVQAGRGLVECPHCGSTHVGKAIMAPRIARTDREQRVAAPASQPEAGGDAALPAEPQPQPQRVALLDERQQAVRAMIHELHRKIVENSTDVGPRFPEEARKMHLGETPQRSIYGQASLEEAQALVEEGVPVMPVPTLPEERN
ncbi:MAG TPA: DUF1178 family protein [Beijerinckiaceae bacterium]|jgi:hypothetical protein|nr:DUF1178 family protein [Beijerinckiaceae bacterium]